MVHTAGFLYQFVQHCTHNPSERRVPKLAQASPLRRTPYVQGPSLTTYRQRRELLKQLLFSAWTFTVHLLRNKGSILHAPLMVPQNPIPHPWALPFSHRRYSCSGSWTCTSCDKSACKLEKGAIVTGIQITLKLCILNYPLSIQPVHQGPPAAARVTSTLHS